MQYYTPEEIKNQQREKVTKVLNKLIGKNVKYHLALELASSYLRSFRSGKDSRILDLGAASGHFIKQLYNTGYRQIYAQDLDEYLPTEVRALVKEYKTSDLGVDKLPWPDNNFDLITAWCVLPHLENPFNAAREVARVLKPGGIFIFSAPNLASAGSLEFLKKNGYLASYRESNNHIAVLPTSVVKKTFTRFGLEYLKPEYLVIPKIFRGPRGWLRKILYRFSERFPKSNERLKARWGYNIVYVLRKSSTS